jgi:L-rhamnose mutarotase
MPGYAWVLGVRPGYEDEYKRRHDEIWPEMEVALKEAGITSYSIFRHGLTLFGYFETADLEATIAALGASEVNRRWATYMARSWTSRSTPPPASPTSCPGSGA